LSVTVACQRRKKETQRMKSVWQEMKRKDEDQTAGRADDHGGQQAEA
jgi:hypothetical protein